MDLEYPTYLHDAHNDYPLAPEKKVIKPEQMSEYQRRLMTDLDLAFSNSLIIHKVNYKSLHVYHITCLCLDTQ